MARYKGFKKDGERCTRETDDPTGYCWQHTDQVPVQEEAPSEPKITRRQLLSRDALIKAGIGGLIAETIRALRDALVEEDVYPSPKRILQETAEGISKALSPSESPIQPVEQPTPEGEPVGTPGAPEPAPEPAPTATGTPRPSLSLVQPIEPQLVKISAGYFLYSEAKERRYLPTTSPGIP